MSLAIPPAPDRDLQTKTMSLTPGAAPATSAAPVPKPAVPTPAATAAPVGSTDQLATVNIGSNRPKDVAGVIQALGTHIAHWHLAGLERDTPRGLSAAALAEQLTSVLPGAACDAHPDVGSALKAARSSARPGECVLAFGSFFVAAAVLAESAGADSA